MLLALQPEKKSRRESSMIRRMLRPTETHCAKRMLNHQPHLWGVGVVDLSRILEESSLLDYRTNISGKIKECFFFFFIIYFENENCREEFFFMNKKSNTKHIKSLKKIQDTGTHIPPARGGSRQPELAAAIVDGTTWLRGRGTCGAAERTSDNAHGKKRE